MRNARPPAASTEIFVIGKQWMWHLQHPEGPREINELHVPVGVPVKLTMTSQDVIHDFYIPAFRVKKDVLPGRYSSIWFQPTRDRHVPSFLRAILRHEPLRDDRLGLRDVADGLRHVARGRRENESMAQQGERLFSQFGCATCHVAEGSGRAPSLAGIYGKAGKDSERRNADRG